MKWLDRLMNACKFGTAFFATDEDIAVFEKKQKRTKRKSKKVKGKRK